MQTLLKLLDQTGDSLHEGFVTTYLGRRKAALFFLLLESVVPPSVSNLFWIGLIALGAALMGWQDVPASIPWLAGYVVATVVGAWSLYRFLCEMAQRPRSRSPSSKL